MDPVTYYATQSPVSDPGAHAGRFSELPRTVAGLAHVVHGLYVHYVDGKVHGYTPPPERLPEVNLRYVDEMLSRIVALDDRPLIEPRPPERRLVGYCRDAALLFCAMARHVGISARHRVGFATYFAGTGPEAPGAHEIAEYWDPLARTWRLIDPHMDYASIVEHGIEFDVCDVPRDLYIVAGKAWQMCRSGEADPQGFGIGDFRGMWIVLNNLIQDLAALNKAEPLNWDNWGLMLKDFDALSAEELDLLDRVAELTQAGDEESFARMRKLYEKEPGLRMPRTFKSFSPVSPPAEITLR